jgi:hypothetical protein
MNPLENYGALGIVVSALAWFVLKIMRDHKQERKEWSERSDKNDERNTKVISDNTKAVSDNTTAFKIFFESNRNK